MLPQIVYLQTMTACNGHCHYCPFDDVYGEEVVKMDYTVYAAVLEWLKRHNYKGRIGYLLHYEPTLDTRLSRWIDKARAELPGVSLEIATNGLVDSPVLKKFDKVDCVPAGSLKVATSRAGNVRQCKEIEGRGVLRSAPCPIPVETMPIAANGEVLLCCQDWRHEAVVGTYKNLDAAREKQLSLMPKVHSLDIELCQDCMAGKYAEEVGERLGKRVIDKPKKKVKEK